MPYASGLVSALRNEGLSVEMVPGYATRGRSSFYPHGAVCHWTAGPSTGDRPSLNVCTYGRPGLSGPLCNVFLTRGGVAVVVAYGRANHAGKGSWKRLVGNSSVFGTEAESSGKGWTDAQRWAYPRINAAYAKLAGFDASMVCGHNEWAPSRKIDIQDWPMSRMREQVSDLLSGTSSKPAPPEPEKPVEPGSRVTAQGDHGKDVEFLQKFLGIEQDGKFGPATEAALKAYQGDRDLDVDGRCGPATWATIKEESMLNNESIAKAVVEELMKTRPGKNRPPVRDLLVGTNMAGWQSANGVAQLAGQVAGMTEALKGASTGGVDLKAVQQAAEAGTKQALESFEATVKFEA